jgi:hypothetical protein
MKRIALRGLTLGSIITATLLLSGCGGGGSSSSTLTTPEATKNETTTKKGTGFYVDSAVEGVEFVCGDSTGVTDSNGTFTFDENSTCTFSLGDVVLREVSATNLVDSVVILEDNVTIARFLQSLDIDGNPDNGIEIDAGVRATLAEQNLTKVAKSDDDVANMVISLQNTESYQGQMVTKEDAEAHITRTKESLKGENHIAMTSNITSASDDTTAEDSSHTGTGNMGVSGSASSSTEGSSDNPISEASSHMGTGNMGVSGSTSSSTEGSSDNPTTEASSHRETNNTGTGSNSSATTHTPSSPTISSSTHGSTDTNISGEGDSSSMSEVSNSMNSDGKESRGESHNDSTNTQASTDTTSTNSTSGGMSGRGSFGR